PLADLAGTREKMHADADRCRRSDRAYREGVAMPINPIRISHEIEARFRRYLETTFHFPDRYADLRDQFGAGLAEPGRLFRGPYLHGLAPYVLDVPITELIRRGVLPKAVGPL